jgi:hypothetical protein
MATIAYTTANIETGSRAILVHWATLTTDDASGSWFESFGPFCDHKSVHVFGTFNGAQISIEGANLASPGAGQSHVLHSNTGYELLFTEGDIRSVDEVPHGIRPVLTGGDESTDVDVYLFCVSSSRH